MFLEVTRIELKYEASVDAKLEIIYDGNSLLRRMNGFERNKEKYMNNLRISHEYFEFIFEKMYSHESI